jgi:hypothetical protein
MSSRLDSLRVDGPLASRLPSLSSAVPDWPLAVLGGLVATTAALLPGLERPAVTVLVVLSVTLGLLSRAGRSDQPRSWLTPAALRALEYASIWAAGRTAGQPLGTAAAFAVISVIAMHHYDVVYRIRSGQPVPPPHVAWALGGWELRCLLLVIALAFEVVLPALWLLATWCVVVLVSDRIRLFSRSGDRR